MPELPEVETVKLGLEKVIRAKKILTTEIFWKKSFPYSTKFLQDNLYQQKIIKVRRRAKILIIDLENSFSLLFHLKMTGQIIFVKNDKRVAGGHPNDSFIHGLPDKSTRVVFNFNDGSKLFFNDQRKFGWIKFLPTAEIKQEKFMMSVGPEPLTDRWTWQELKARAMRHQNSKIKTTILDQTVVAGVGNIYAVESLWQAKIHPLKLVKDLKDSEWKKLWQAIRETMTQSIKSGGSSLKNYVKADGQKGDYLKLFAKLYNKEGNKCPRCKTLITKIKVAGRGTYLCAQCQKI